VPTPESFGPYRVLEKVSQGAFSEIFKVEKEGRTYVLKKLLDYMKYDVQYRELLENEQELLKLIGHHPRFPALYDFGNHDDQLFLILEFIAGLNLKAAMERTIEIEHTVSPPLACHLLSEICAGLEFLHDLSFDGKTKLVHGDLRASNVMVASNVGVKLIDLGLKVGTFDYMPLERHHHRILGPYTDIYAAGHILYELLHQKHLFQGKTKLEAYFEMREIEISESTFRESLPAAVKKILVKALRQDPDTRYTSARAFREDLEAYLRQAAAPSQDTDIGVWTRTLLQNRP